MWPSLGEMYRDRGETVISYIKSELYLPESSMDTTKTADAPADSPRGAPAATVERLGRYRV